MKTARVDWRYRLTIASRALAAAGAFVYCTGRSATGHPKGMDRPETIDGTVELIANDGAGLFALGARDVDLRVFIFYLFHHR